MFELYIYIYIYIYIYTYNLLALDLVLNVKCRTEMQIYGLVVVHVRVVLYLLSYVIPFQKYHSNTIEWSSGVLWPRVLE